MLIKLISIRPKLGPVNEIADLIGINYENAKTISRRYKLNSAAYLKLKKQVAHCPKTKTIQKSYKGDKFEID